MAEAAQAETKTIAFVLYPGITILDLVGPLQVLGVLSVFDPGYETAVVAERIEQMPTDTALRVSADRTFADVPRPYALVIPGGMEPTLRALTDETLLDYVRHSDAEFVTSVCTGSLVLGAAGLLEGRRATTHWMFREQVAAFGAIPTAQRIVEDGPVITAAGVSAGIDMALRLVARLADEETARLAQLMIEYDPEPFGGGIDWDSVDIESYAPIREQAISTALPDHPELAARLRDPGIRG